MNGDELYAAVDFGMSTTTTTLESNEHIELETTPFMTKILHDIRHKTITSFPITINNML